MTTYAYMSLPDDNRTDKRKTARLWHALCLLNARMNSATTAAVLHDTNQR